MEASRVVVEIVGLLYSPLTKFGGRVDAAICPS